MRSSRHLLLLCALAALASCGDPGPDRYPVTGQPCAASDPVRGLEANDCLPPA